jgi:hypothetical protein
VTVWAALAGGFLGTLVLRAASEVKLTRMDLPFLLGTVVTADRGLAKALGYLAHFMFGLLFALGYLAIFEAIGRDGWLLGAALGAVHGAFAATALVAILLPIVHPRMGNETTGSNRIALLEPPGFLMRNYGPGTPIVGLIAHVIYGAIVGWSIAAAGVT